ncbi:LPD23 domain-containing protein [Campylobacter upsaliensis]|uniref:putative barnase/colicin E5 family endoribonuclease n=1 Tax=Campylobacter upsaliensis TaxID=28080 RepID=UPI0022EA5E62|nr:LPD23 domain-containing protein [Campylobacter upsaliensis]
MLNSLIKYAKGQGEKGVNNLQKIKAYLGEENNAFLEMQILNRLFKESVVENHRAKVRVFDSEGFLNRVKELVGDTPAPLGANLEARALSGASQGPSKQENFIKKALNEAEFKERNAFIERFSHLKGLLFSNENTGIKASFGTAGLKKMTSDKAILKSVNNGFSVKEHLEAVKNIKELYEKASYKGVDDDVKHSDKAVKIHRFISEFEGGNAEILVKESLDKNQNKIYTLELKELHKDNADIIPTFIRQGSKGKAVGTTAESITQPLFKSKEAREFLELVEGFHKLYKNDAIVAKNFTQGTASQLSTSIATSAEGAIKQKVVKGGFDPIFRLLPDGVLFGLFSKQIQGGALRYHLRKALSRSLNYDDFKIKLEKELKRTNFNSNTSRLIEKFMQNLEDFNAEKEAKLAQIREEEELQRAEELKRLNKIKAAQENAYHTQEANLGQDILETELKEDFGVNFEGFKGKEAINKLLEEKRGQVKGAFYKEGLGEIDLVWGDENFGLRHIIDKHGDEFEDIAAELDEIIAKGVLEKGEHRYFIKHNDYKGMIALDYKGKESNAWILTLYKDKSALNPAYQHQIKHNTNTSSETRANGEFENSNIKNANLQKEKVDKLFHGDAEVISAQGKFNELEALNLTDEDIIPQQKIKFAMEKFNYDEKNAKFAMQKLNEKSDNIYHSNPHLGAGLVGGVLNGVEQDENGNLSFDPVKFAMGFLGGAAGSKAVKESIKWRANKVKKAYPNIAKNNPALMEQIAKRDLLTYAKNETQNALTRLLNKNKLFDSTKGLFAGEKALLNEAYAPHKARLEKAKELEGSGADEIEIWEKTGWYKDKDHKWKFEISQRGGELDLAKIKDKDSEAKLGEILKDDELFKAYPQLRDMSVKHVDLSGNYGFYYVPYNDIKLVRPHIQLDIDEIKTSPYKVKEVLYHEIQHAIQHKEQFAYGLSYMAETYERYLKQHGEVEARNIQERMKNPTKIHPHKTMDTDIEDTIAESALSTEYSEAFSRKLEKSFLDESGRIAYKALIHKAEVLPQSLNLKGFKQMIFNNDKTKQLNAENALIKTPVGEVKVNVLRAFNHYMKNGKNGNHKENRQALNATFMPTLLEPKFVTRDEEGTMYYYKPFISKDKEYHITSIAVKKNGNLDYATSYNATENRLRQMIKHNELVYEKD